MVSARHLLISGHVQGVWFRESMRQEADRVGAVGWVRNLPGGRVEAHVEGDADAVAALEAWAQHGPDRADVADVVAMDAAPAGHTDFSRRPTPRND